MSDICFYRFSADIMFAFAVSPLHVSIPPTPCSHQRRENPASCQCTSRSSSKPGQRRQLGTSSNHDFEDLIVDHHVLRVDVPKLNEKISNLLTILERFRSARLRFSATRRPACWIPACFFVTGQISWHLTGHQTELDQGHPCCLPQD